MKTKTINLYEFSELSEKAKEKVGIWIYEGLDFSLMYNFDGDIDELESEVYNLIEPNTIYI